MPGCEGAVAELDSHLLQLADASAVAEAVAAFLWRYWLGTRPDPDSER